VVNTPGRALKIKALLILHRKKASDQPYIYQALRVAMALVATKLMSLANVALRQEFCA
jgi:hypothetical protein